MTFRIIQGGRRTLTRLERELIRSFARLLRDGTDASKLAAAVTVLGFEIERRGFDEQRGLEWAVARLTELGLGPDQPIELRFR